jgi:hypothetical protein
VRLVDPTDEAVAEILGVPLARIVRDRGSIVPQTIARCLAAAAVVAVLSWPQFHLRPHDRLGQFAVGARSAVELRADQVVITARPQQLQTQHSDPAHSTKVIGGSGSKAGSLEEVSRPARAVLSHTFVGRTSREGRRRAFAYKSEGASKDDPIATLIAANAESAPAAPQLTEERLAGVDSIRLLRQR